jgi:hypothetical protein
VSDSIARTSSALRTADAAAWVTDVGGSLTTITIDRLAPNGTNDCTFARQTIDAGGIVLNADADGAPDGDILVATDRDGQSALWRRTGSDGTGTTGGGLDTIDPARLLETRSGPGAETIDGQFQGAGQRPAESITKVKIAGRGGVPADATTAMLNLVAVRPTGPGYLTIYPCTDDVPLAATLNYQPGSVVANAVYAKLNTTGEVCIFTKAATDIVIDVNGYVPG